MNKDDMKKYGIGAGGGAIAFLVIAVWFFGWFVTAGSAEKQAAERSQAAVATALTPYCVATAQADPEYDERLATIQGQSSANTNRRSITSFGWAIPPGGTTSNAALADSCVIALKAS